MPNPHKTPMVMARGQFVGTASPTSRHPSSRQRRETHTSKNNHGTLTEKNVMPEVGNKQRKDKRELEQDQPGAVATTAARQR